MIVLALWLILRIVGTEIVLYKVFENVNSDLRLPFAPACYIETHTISIKP